METIDIMFFYMFEHLLLYYCWSPGTILPYVNEMLNPICRSTLVHPKVVQC